ncbi:hypothetical protein [Haloferax gibbonsii]|nr:hypothetical protein [Haloferax gibbonsii]
MSARVTSDGLRLGSGLPEWISTEHRGDAGEQTQEWSLNQPRDARETHVRTVMRKDCRHREHIRFPSRHGLVERPNCGFELAWWAERRPNDEGVDAAVSDTVGLAGCDGQRFAGKQDVRFTASRHLCLTRDYGKSRRKPRASARG